MICSPFDLNDYFFGALAPAERLAVEAHLAACPECREDVAALTNTRSSLLSVADEEPPRRIAFVSDKVFEPRWWQRMWASGPGFAAASALAIAIVIHGFAVRPVAVVAPPSSQLTATEAEIDRRVRAEVARVIAASESGQMGRVLELVNARLRQSDSKMREEVLNIQEYYERMDKRNSVLVRRVAYE